MTPQDQTAGHRATDLAGRLAMILGTAIIGLSTIFWILFLGEQAEVAWQAQVDLVRFEQRAARVNGDEWRAMAQREVDPAEAAELAQDKKEMLQIVAAMESEPHHGQDIDEFVTRATEYVQAVDRELNLLEYDRYPEAQREEAGKSSRTLKSWNRPLRRSGQPTAN